MLNIENSELETERLYMRRFRTDDIDVFSQILGQDEVGQWLPRGRGYTKNEVEKFLTNIIKHWDDNGYGIWAVVEKESGNFIGHCGLNYVKQCDAVELLYGFGKEYWGKGYATEAAKSALQFGFDKVGLKKIVAFTKIDNIASRRVIEKAGFRYVKDIGIFGMVCAYYELCRE